MGAWGDGVFENDYAADWVAEFDELDDKAERRELIDSAFSEVAEEEEYVEVDVASAAVAAAATVASLVPGGPAVDEAYGPKTLAELPVDVDADLRRRASAALRKVLDPESEWSELWDEGDGGDEARRVVTRLVEVLTPPSN